MSDSPSGTTSASPPDLTEQAIRLAGDWVAASAQVPASPAAARLADALADPAGLQFAMGFVDGVLRPESLTAAAIALQRIAPLAPETLPAPLRAALQVGGVVAPVLPAPTVPIARRLVRGVLDRLVLDARPDRLGAALARLREDGARLCLHVLGGGVLGEAEALRRLETVHDLVRRDDVDEVSFSLPTIAGHVSVWAFDEMVERITERLRPLYLSAAEDGTILTLDTEAYRDLDLTTAVFQRVLSDPRLAHLEAGIVLQTSLPDSLDALERLTDWARDRVAAGGARIRIRLVKGANVAMERTDAVLHGWAPATYPSKLDTDANHIRCLDAALRPERTAAVRVGVAGHNLFHLAYAWQLAGARGVRGDIAVEMLLGVAEGQAAAVAETVGEVRRSVPVVPPEGLEDATGYLLRRLEEHASPDHFLSAAARLSGDPALFARERDRFVAALARAAEPSLPTGPRRRQDRRAGEAGDEPRLRRPGPGAEETDAGLTAAVLGIAEAAAAGETQPLEPEARQVLFGPQASVQTAVFSARETTVGAGAPGFRNAPTTDPALPGNRAWAREILARVPASTIGTETARAARIETEAQLADAVARVRRAAEAWGALPAADRSAVLLRAANALERRRGELIEVAVAETGMPFPDADAAASAAVDAARYAASTVRELDSLSGAVFVPDRLTVVAPSAHTPVSDAAGDVLAALAAGSGVVCSPAPQTMRVAAVVTEAVREALAEAGVDRDVLALLDVGEEELEAALISRRDVDRVLLAGSAETVERLRSWRPDLALQAETGGSNAIVVMPSADLDLAASDIVRSAFAHAGQDRAAASLAILVGPVGRSKRFARRLVDATTSLRVGSPADPLTEVGPLVAPPDGSLRWALTTLDEEEQWLVEPRELPSDAFPGRLWTPGIRVGVRPDSRMHRGAFAGPVLGIMHATSLAQAIELQNAAGSGLTAGLHTQDPAELALWLSEVEAGNLSVNRDTLGRIAQRQPFGGWKRSAVGAGGKSGGPNRLVRLGSWRPTSGGTASATLHLRGLDSRIAALVESAQPTLGLQEFEWLRRAALSDAVAWDRTFARVVDVSQLGVERNLFRYRPADAEIRALPDAGWHEVLRTVVARVRAGGRGVLSAPVALPGAVRRTLGDLDVPVFLEDETAWLERMAASGAAVARPERVRLVGRPESAGTARAALAEAIDGDPTVTVYADPVTTAGRIELLPFLREQAISITAHRFGIPDPWSEGVI